MPRKTKHLTRSAAKNVMTDAMVDAFQDSGYGDLIAKDWIEYVSVSPEKPEDSLPAEPEDLVVGESGEFEVYIPARFFATAFSDKRAGQHNPVYSNVDIDERAIEDWLNSNLEGVLVKVDRVVDEGSNNVYYPPGSNPDDPDVEPMVLNDVTVYGTVHISAKSLRLSLKRYKAYKTAGRNSSYRSRTRSKSLRARREAARDRIKAKKTFNLKWVNDTIDQIVTELSEYSDREPEIAAALESMLAAKRLVSGYSQRMLDTPYRSKSIKYDPQAIEALNLVTESFYELAEETDLVYMLDHLKDLEDKISEVKNQLPDPTIVGHVSQLRKVVSSAEEQFLNVANDAIEQSSDDMQDYTTEYPEVIDELAPQYSELFRQFKAAFRRRLAQKKRR